MTKKEIKELLKKHGFTTIAPSWYYGDPSDKSVLVTAYDKCGTPFQFFINYGAGYARSQMFSVHGVEHELYDVSYIFFKEAKA